MNQNHDAARLFVIIQRTHSLTLATVLPFIPTHINIPVPINPLYSSLADLALGATLLDVVCKVQQPSADGSDTRNRARTQSHKPYVESSHPIILEV